MMRKLGVFLTVILAMAVLAGIVILPSNTAHAEGVTIITHGFCIGSSDTPGWLDAMRNAIADKWLGGEKNYATITVTGTKGNLTVTCSPWNVNLASSASGEILVILDWSAVANHLVTGVSAQEVAAAVVPAITQGKNSALPLAELPIHLIGHSRGSSLICELARLLGEQGVVVDHLTPLDPHPLTDEDPQPSDLPTNVPDTVDAAVGISENVLFADCYLQRLTFPMGQIVSGAYNREWSSLPGGYANNPSPENLAANHLNIHLAYQATVNLTTSSIHNNEAILSSGDRVNWFTAYETDGSIPGERAGFYYSRIARNDAQLSTDQPNGSERPIDGFNANPLLGGAGERTTLTWSSAVWPNLAAIKALRDGIVLGPGVYSPIYGEILTAEVVGLDADSACSVTFYLDRDRNPYNGNNWAIIGTRDEAAGSSSFFADAISWDANMMTSPGSYFIYAAVTDGSRTRYLYASPEFDLVSTAAEGWMLYDY